MTVYFNPENWLVSTTRALEDYTLTKLGEILGRPAEDLYEVIMQFPGTILDLRMKKMPLEKTVIHFELDDTQEGVLGFGENIQQNNYDSALGNYPQEAGIRLLDFDVGIWASDRSGGTTSRMETRQLLSQLFSGAQAIQNLRAATDGGDGGIEIQGFSGGRGATDTINDVIVYRQLDSTLSVRVFSRTPKPTVPVPTIEAISQSPTLTILG